MKTKITIYLINGENLTEVLDKDRREVELETEKMLTQEKVLGFRYTDGYRFIPVSSLLYMDIKEIS